MPYDPEAVIRDIGQAQYNAMSKLWSQPSDMVTQPFSGSENSSSDLLGPWAQSLMAKPIEPQNNSYDPYGDQALADLNSLKSSVARESQIAEYGKAVADAQRHQSAMAKKAQAEGTRMPDAQTGAPAATYGSYGSKALKPTIAPASSTGGGASSGAFPYADTVKGYIPDDLKEDPELMRIIAAGSKAESGWDPRRVQPGGGAKGLFQFDPNGMGKGIPDSQLFDPNYQASRIVPMYVDAYRRRAQSGLTDPAQVASWVAAQAERPFDYQNPNSAARRNYAAAYQGLANQTASQNNAVSQPQVSGNTIPIVRGGLSSSYWTSGGTHGGHPAADIFAPAGTPIYAPVGGTAMPGVYPAGGNAVTIRGDDGRFYYMAHGKVPFAGGRIEAGQAIGQVGNTGNAASTASHVHFAIATKEDYFNQWNGSGDVMGGPEYWNA
jgi:murein DD-endopeptidase MepM/ murein hydrolase activator NlpD